MEIDEHGTVHGKRIRFHCLRKFLIDRLSAYAGESQWKQIVGKAIDEGAYVSQDQLRGVFQRAMKDLLINGNGKTQKLIEMENALKAVEYENAISKTRIDALQKNSLEQQTEHKKDMDELKALVTQLLNHERDMNFNVIQPPKEKKESEEILNQREQQFKKIAPEYTHPAKEKA